MTVNNNGNLHIGQLIKSVFDASGLSVAELARGINCERTNVYKIFNRSTIDVELLVRISEVMGHNFLADVMKHYGFETRAVTCLSFNVTLADLTEENIAALSETISSFGNTDKGSE